MRHLAHLDIPYRFRTKQKGHPRGWPNCLFIFAFFGRSDRIRTCDPCVPNPFWPPFSQTVTNNNHIKSMTYCASTCNHTQQRSSFMLPIGARLEHRPNTSLVFPRLLLPNIVQGSYTWFWIPNTAMNAPIKLVTKEIAAELLTHTVPHNSFSIVDRLHMRHSLDEIPQALHA